MKKINLLGYLSMAFFLIFMSCTSEEGTIETNEFNQKSLADTEDCGECEGQMTYLEFEYQGDGTNVTVDVYGHKGSVLGSFNNLNSGDLFSFVGNRKHNKVGPEISLVIDGGTSVDIHTSCSLPIYVGMIAGDFMITAGTSHGGGNLVAADGNCPVVECIEVLGYHEACGICESGSLQTFLAFGFIELFGADGFDIELLKDVDGCDVSNSSIVGNVNVSMMSETEMKVTYTVDAGYEICSIDFNYGDTQDTLDLNYTMSFDAPTTSHSFVVSNSGFGANIYFTPGAQISE